MNKTPLMSVWIMGLILFGGGAAGALRAESDRNEKDEPWQAAPPHNRSGALASAKQRIEMLQLARHGNRAFRTS